MPRSSYSSKYLSESIGSSKKHRYLVERSFFCGCYSCEKIFLTGEITEWVDNGKTAVCPYCGTDAVLPDELEDLNYVLLREMRIYWFSPPSLEINDTWP